MSENKDNKQVETELNEAQQKVMDEQVAQNETILDEQTLEQAEAVVENDLQAMLEAAQAEAQAQKELAMRTLADMENLRRRTRLDVEGAHKYALEKFVDALIPVMDSMEMGMDAVNKEEASLDSLKEGMEMTLKQFLDVLQNFNVERVDPVGEKFNPQLHEAMTMVPSPDHESQTVMEVFQKGYTLNERLVRPARVIVAQ